jgi:CheY-like chemotaxis protein
MKLSSSLKYEVVPLAEVPENDSSLQNAKPQPRILVVDDEKVIADTLSMILSQSGYIVTTAYDAFAALKLVDDSAPDLLITDVVMPDMTGIELAIELQSRAPDCKILLFSGQAATRDFLQKARDDGHDFSIMMKPVYPTDMLNRIRECLSTQGLHSASMGTKFVESAPS